MSTICQRVPVETYNVEISDPKSLVTRCGECFRSCLKHSVRFIASFLCLSFLFVTFGLVWVVSDCHIEPGMNLEAMRINDMMVYQNSTSSPWHVNSAFDVDLGTWNPNKVAGCHTTFRRIIVRVEYRGQVILRQEVPLGFGLKPRSARRTVSMEVKGNGFELMNPHLGPVLEKELRSNKFSLEFFFDARYLRNDRKKNWASYGCQVVAKTPSNSTSQAGANSMLTKYCLRF